jgi:hypothetical protein
MSLSPLSLSPPEDMPDISPPPAAARLPGFAATFAAQATAPQLDYMTGQPPFAQQLIGQRGIGFNGGRQPGEPASDPESHDGVTSSSSSSDTSEGHTHDEMYGSPCGTTDEGAHVHGRQFCGASEGGQAGAEQPSGEIGTEYQQALAVLEQHG